MTFEIWLVFGILATTIVLFVSDRLRLDVIAIMALLALMLTGLLTPAEALAGFSDPVVLIIAGLFVVGSALFQTGAAGAMGKWMAQVAGTGEVRLLVVIMLAVALLSAFLSSTGTVAVFLPVVVSLAVGAKISPAKLLIPMAYASLIGGMLTLIGTPPNLIVANQLSAVGLAPFSFFAFTPVGLVMLVIGVLFMVFIGRHLLPDRSEATRGQPVNERAQRVTMSELMDAYQLPGNLFRLRVRQVSPLNGQRLDQANLRARYHVNVLQKQAWPNRRAAPAVAHPVSPQSVIVAHDILHIQGAPEQVAQLAREQELGILPTEATNGHLMAREVGLAEVLLTPRSRLVEQTIKDVRFRDTYGVTVLSIKRLGEPLHESPEDVQLRFGDTLLVQGTWKDINRLQRNQQDFVVVGLPGEMDEDQPLSGRAYLAIGIMLVMLVLITLEVVPTVTAVLLAAAAMVLSGCLSMEDAYRTMNWESIILIAGMLPMATALENTGGIQLIANSLTGTLGSIGPLAVLAGLFLLTSVFSQFISNTATTVLVAPIAFQAATALGVSPYPLLLTVAIAASTAFATPIASPVNTLVLGPGGYRFADFAKVGVLLQLVMLLATVLVVPLLFPL